MECKYEVTRKPWFGPRKRAFDKLRSRTHILPPAQAFSKFKEILGDQFDHVQHIRFIDFSMQPSSAKRKKDVNFRYTIAVIQMSSDSIVREKVYEKADDFVRLTGWYPLSQGERIESVDSLRDFDSIGIASLEGPKEILLGSEIENVHAIGGPDDGCGIRIVTNDGALVLDAGLPNMLERSGQDRAIILSHAHLDHSGGVVEGEFGEIPVILSKDTARILHALKMATSDFLKLQARIIDIDKEITMGGLSIRAYAVPHFPGSTGFIIRGSNTSVVYTGDVVLKSPQYDFLPKLKDLIRGIPGGRPTLLLDATRAGRVSGPQNASVAGTLLNYAHDSHDIVIISESVERLLYAYLDIFLVAKTSPFERGNFEFIVTEKLRPLFNVIHGAFITRTLSQLDPFLEAQYGKSMSAWAESRFLFWLSSTFEPSNDESKQRVWFISNDEAFRLENRHNARFLPIGRGSSNISQFLPESKIINADSDVWNLHTRDSDLAEAIKELQPICDIFLFHNYKKRLLKFIRSNGLDCNPLDKERPKFKEQR